MKCNFGGLRCPNEAKYHAVSQDVRNPSDTLACDECAINYAIAFDDIAFFLLDTGKRNDPIANAFKEVKPDASDD